MKIAVYSIVAALSAVVSLSAQETSAWTFKLGAGFTEPVGRTGFYTDTGWTTSAGLGFNFNSHVGALIDVDVNNLGVNPTTLSNIGVPGGSVSVFSATLDPIVHLNPHGRFDVYLTGGGGEYRREQNFVQPIYASTGYGAAPYFGFAGPGNQIIYSSSVNKPGVDGGVGIAIGTKWHGKVYAEMKYDKIFLSGPYHTDYMPVTFGYRW